MPDLPAAPLNPPPKISIWRSVLLSIKGEQHDYTSLPLNQAVLFLAVPMVLEMVMESLFAVGASPS